MVDYQAAIKMTFQNIFKDLKKYLLYNIELGRGLKEKKKTYPRPDTWHTSEK